MSFVSGEVAAKVAGLELATIILVEVASGEISKVTTSDVHATALGVMVHISRQLQVLLEIQSGVTTVQAPATVAPAEVN